MAVVAFGMPARADVTHVVQRGHTVEAIAHRYRTTVKAILDANHLKDTTHLKPGQTLIIPGVEPPKKKGGTNALGRAEHPAAMSTTRAMRDAPPAPRGRDAQEGDIASSSSVSGTIHAVRLGEHFRIKVKDSRGHISPNALKAFEHLMRHGSATHPVDPRLVALVAIVSNHFGGKPIDVVSGYRPYAPTQYTLRSNHNYGKAIDFRIEGVDNEALRDFCRTLRSAGCGYYPNDTFVHMDARETKAYWVDTSQPGQPPKYDKPGAAADEGHTDVPDEKAPTGASVEQPATYGAPPVTTPPAEAGVPAGIEDH
ncbi:MAG: DUF882 domain-containing protein [Myxococcota bacterium]|nr:DUF882 domain-containing protein [Myxococcota bacterium]